MSKPSTQSIDSEVEVNSAQILSHLICPSCSSTSLLSDSSTAVLKCNHCGSLFPIIRDKNADIPLLFANPHAAVQGWSARLNGFTQKNNQQIAALKDSLNDNRISKVTRQRIKTLQQAKQKFGEQLNTQLQFFQQQEFSQEILAAATLAQNQGVDSYINNIFRDWAWENGENEELLEALQEVFPTSTNSVGKVLTLGAGAGRLSFDFHHAYSAEHSVLLDINPFLLTVANKIINGDTISLYEFPIAPISSDSFSILQQCSAPHLNPNSNANVFSYVMADVSNVPFEAKTFDTILTPWLIDIIPLDLREFIPHISRLLKKDGVWLNTGSLAFFHKNAAWNYSEEEVIDLLDKFGFEVINTNRKKVHYLHSPHSTHGRIENIFSFCVRKKFDSVPPKTHAYLPDWITNSSKAIPQFEELIAFSSKFLLQAQVLAAIDGKRSINEISQLLANQYDMPEESAKAAVRQILIDNFQESRN